MKVKYEKNFGRFDKYFEKNMTERYIDKPILFMMKASIFLLNRYVTQNFQDITH